jgi:MFS family permease
MDTTQVESQRRRLDFDLRRFSLGGALVLVRAHPLLSALLATIVLMEIVHGIEMLALFPLYLFEVEQESASLIALTISTYLVVDILTRTPAGWLADRLGRKPILLAGIILSLAPLPLMMQTKDQNLFLLLNAVNGLGAGCIWPSIYASIADTYGTGRRGLIFGLVNTVMLGGLASGPISGNLLIGISGSFTTSFLVCIALVLLELIIVAFGVKETQTPLVASDVAAPTRSPLGSSFITPQIVILFAVVLCITLGIAFLVPVLTLYGKDVLHLTPTQFGLTLALPAVATAIALVPFGHWVDRFGSKWPLVSGIAVFATCLWLTPISTFPPLVSMGATIGGLGYALAIPAWNALTMDRIPQDARGTLLGVVAALQGVGLVMGPYLGGALWEQVSPFAPFLAAACSMTIGALLALFVRDAKT